jgi:hypothetical protein
MGFARKQDELQRIGTNRYDCGASPDAALTPQHSRSGKVIIEGMPRATSVADQIVPPRCEQIRQ